MVDFFDTGIPDSEIAKDPVAFKRAAAVAIKHELEKRGLPTISAAGYGAVAEKILQIAFESGVKVRTDPELAQMLAAIELDSEIPSEALVAVAEILSYVYKANSKFQDYLEQQAHEQNTERDTAEKS